MNRVVIKLQVSAKALPIIFFIVLIASIQDVGAQSSDCQLPREWKGDWFLIDSQPNLVKIEDRSINLDNEDNLLGTCIKQGKGKDALYLFQKQEWTGKCTKCVFVDRLHSNVLSYKESENCIEYGPLSSHLEQNSDDSSFCDDVHIQPRHYLIKEHFDPVPCPFRKEPYIFSYELGKRDICAEPPSHVESCYDQTQLVFNYQGCHDKNNSQAKIEEIKCVGHWKDGSNNFLIATVHEQMSNLKVADKRQAVDHLFRCFIFEEVRNASISRQRVGDDKIGYKISRSGMPASCQGLHDTNSGEMSLTLYLGDANQTSCSFPPWFSSKSKLWHSLDYHRHFEGSSKGKEILYSINSSMSGDGKRKLVCRQSAEQNGKFTVFAKEVIGCTEKYICIKLSKNGESGSIVNLELHYQGEILTMAEFQKKCFNPEFNVHENITITRNDSLNITLIEDKMALVPLPFELEGVYKLTKFHQKYGDFVKPRNCSSRYPFDLHPEYFTAGCRNGNSVLELKDDCEDTGFKSRNPANCIGEWKDQGFQYFLLSYIQPTSHPIIYCFRYKNHIGEELMFQGNRGHCFETNNNDLKHFTTNFNAELKMTCEKEKETSLGSNDTNNILELTSSSFSFRLWTSTSLSLFLIIIMGKMVVSYLLV